MLAVGVAGGSHGRPLKCVGASGHDQLMAGRSPLEPGAPWRHRLWSLLGGAAVVLVACVQVGTQPPDVPTNEKGIERALRRAEKDLSRGDYPAAGESAREILAHSSPQGELRGRALTVLGKVLFFNSRASFKRGVPPGEFVEGRRQVAEELTDEWESVAEDLRLAEEALREAIRVGGPSSSEARHFLAQVLFTLRRPDEAAAELDAYFSASERRTTRETERRAILLRSCLDYLRSEPVILGKEPEAFREITLPERRSDPAPQYTQAARDAGLTGVVVVEVIIDETGKVRCARPLMGLPLGLTEAAVDTLWKWTWEPAELEGQPVAVHYPLFSNFRLR